jgi:ABC-type branched-subunit amino acid transport system ATPase component/ABC-type branched-subunit amino acid transport system permease subunit
MIVQRLLIAGALAFVAALPYLGWLPGWTLALATVTAFGTVSLIGLNLIYGVTGMLALGQAAFVAIPGYASGILEKFGVSAFVSIPLGIVFAALVARLVAEIFIRLPGIYFAIGTLGFAFVVEGLARAFPSVTGGASGLVLEPPFPLRRDGWYMVALVALAIGIASFALLVRGRFLRTLKIVRHDELAAQVMGVDVVRVKANVFTIGSTYSAVGGVLLAYYVAVLAPEAGGVNASLESLAMLVIGGAGSLFGPLLGAGAIQWLFAISGRADRYELLVYGVAFFCVVLYAPSGIAGALRAGCQRAIEALGRKTAPAAAVPPARELTIADDNVGREGICLRVEKVSKNFGGLRAVQDVSFDVSFGQIVALIGPNGAGKSTLFNIISGIEPPTEGRVVLQGEDMLGVPIHRRAAAIGRSFQVPRLVPDLTVVENVVARLDHLPDAPRERASQHIARAQLESFGLAHFADVPARQIGLGHHKLIELVRASAGSPALLLLDEPAVGLTAEEVTRLADLLQILKRRGAAILVVEHNIGFVSTIADEVVVLDTGRLIARDKPQVVMADPRVREVYLGALV